MRAPSRQGNRVCKPTQHLCTAHEVDGQARRFGKQADGQGSSCVERSVCWGWDAVQLQNKKR